MSVYLIQSDARALPLADGSVQTCITSPPYFALRDYGVDGQLGSERTPDEYVAAMVSTFREVRRVLRDDGTLWLNLGDSYAAGGKGGGGSYMAERAEAAWQKQSSLNGWRSAPPGLKPKDLCNIPHRVAMALQADGWWHRDTVIWAKPNPMPSSVTDRTTTAHEYVFLLTKKARYFYDADAIREPITSTGGSSFGKQNHDANGTGQQSRRLASPEERNNPLGRNKRSVWTIPTQSFHGAHFATFPTRLVEPMIRAGTSEKGCCAKCGAPWRRVVERVGLRELRVRNVEGEQPKHSARVEMGMLSKRTGLGGSNSHNASTPQSPLVHTVAWVPTCSCHAGDPVPCRVLDCFSGAGTTVMVADRLGRDGIGCELKLDYLKMSRERIEHDRQNRKHGKVKRRRERKPAGEQTLFGAAV